MDDGSWLTVEQASALLQVHPETVREWLRDGRLAGNRISRRAGWRVRRSAVEDFLAGNLSSSSREPAESPPETLGRLEEVASLRDGFTRAMVHELSTPIAAIRMLADALLGGGVAPERQTTLLMAIRAEANMLATLVADARLAAMAGRDDLLVRPAPTLVSELLTDIVAFAQSLPGAHPFAVVDETAGTLVLVRADPVRIGQVLRNLLTNAARHTPPGTPIELRIAQHRDRVRIEVVDHGPGINPDDQVRIFQKFERGRDAQASQSSGLGLYLAYQTVQAHGSELKVRSKPGEGSAFWFDLEQAEEPGTIRTLLVDDHPALRESLGLLLQRETNGQVVVVGQASSLAEARTKLDGVDVAVVDVNLPDGSGLDVIRDFKAANPHGRVLILTAAESDRDRARALEMGADGFLTKVTPIMEVIAAVRHLGSGGTLFTPQETADLLRDADRRRDRERRQALAVRRLTPREVEVLRAMARGLADEEVAHQLNISRATLQAHIRNILGKLGTDTRIAAILVASRNDFLRLDGTDDIPNVC